MNTIAYLVAGLSLWFAIIIPGAASNNERAEADDSLYYNERALDKLDSMIVKWHQSYPVQYIDPYESPPSDTQNVDYPDSVYRERISSIPSVIPLSYNKIVNNFIDVYTIKKRNKTEAILGKVDAYFPLFESILDYYELPVELKYLPVIESALHPGAVSRAGATGLWQFMYGTGKLYNLEINSYVDERRDPVKSSHAGAQYLRDLYSIYNDWILVIAAYNCGPGNVNKAIRRTGGKRNYWDIYYYLPRETRGYVPAFIAATYVINYYREHNLIPDTFSHTAVTDTISVREELHFEQIAGILDIPVDQLRDLNPHYRRDVIPAGKKTYSLKLPLSKVGRFISLQDSIFAYKDSIYFNPEYMKSKPSYYSRYSPVTPKNMAKLYYTVKTGDNLGYIAEWYDVRASDLRYWNNIRGSLIRVGQKLVVFVPKTQYEYYKEVNSLSFSEKQSRIGSAAYYSRDKEGNFYYYTVKHGDTLWDIARKYPGISDDEIMQWNNIPNASALKAGQKIKIKRISN